MKNAGSCKSAVELVDKIKEEMDFVSGILRSDGEVIESVDLVCVIGGVEYPVDELRADNGLVAIWTYSDEETGETELIFAAPEQVHFVLRFSQSAVHKNREMGFGYEIMTRRNEAQQKRK